MNIKIKKIITTKEPYQPSGKNYKIYSWIVNGEIDGDKTLNNLELKAFKSIQIEENVIAEVEKQDYMGRISYRIKGIKISEVTQDSPAILNNSRQSAIKHNYSLEEYNNLFYYAWNLFEPRLAKISDPYQRYECLQKLISTFVISAVQHSIKAPPVDERNREQYTKQQRLLVSRKEAES
ncbi:MAG TPA: hypothetical protein PK771_02940 [Spirochaetota bacterium]|nr:hypothetical protein [Spirochaetota bacterium]